METGTASKGRDGAATQTYEERSYPQFDCVSSYVWIWERLSRVNGETTVVARHIHRDDPASG